MKNHHERTTLSIPLRSAQRDLEYEICHYIKCKRAKQRSETGEVHLPVPIGGADSARAMPAPSLRSVCACGLLAIFHAFSSLIRTSGLDTCASLLVVFDYEREHAKWQILFAI